MRPHSLAALACATAILQAHLVVDAAATQGSAQKSRKSAQSATPAKREKTQKGRPPDSIPADRDAAVVAVTRRTLAQIHAGKVNPSHLAPALRQQFTQPKVRRLRSDLREFGPVKSVRLVDRKPGDGKDVATLRILLGETVFIGTVTVTADNRLETFLLLEE